ncbi:hypothetical protein ACGFWD_34430 [Streptomyces sp. NPDC048448]|uniref:hypothetical protein n=1 Tax=unclassified Streptomyces TaxID=2593676 RepID=UPI003412BE11
MGGWLQQRHQAELIREDRKVARAGLVEERGQAAADSALAELHVLRRHVMQREQGLPHAEGQQWRRAAEGHIDQAALAAGLIPEAEEMRVRIRDSLDVVSISVIVESPEEGTSAFESRSATEHVLELLSAYKRGDALPGPTRDEERRRMEREWHDLENPPDAPSS